MKFGTTRWVLAAVMVATGATGVRADGLEANDAAKELEALGRQMQLQSRRSSPAARHMQRQMPQFALAQSLAQLESQIAEGQAILARAVMTTVPAEYKARLEQGQKELDQDQALVRGWLVQMDDPKPTEATMSRIAKDYSALRSKVERALESLKG